MKNKIINSSCRSDKRKSMKMKKLNYTSSHLLKHFIILMIQSNDPIVL